MHDDGGERVRAGREAIEGLRAELEGRYGWTHLELELASQDPERLRVTGTIAVPSLAAMIRGRLAAVLEPGVTLELALGPMPVLRWHAISDDHGVELWAEHPSQARRTLATQLDPADGPLGLLADAGQGRLVRARDGTVGWTLAQLGAPTPARVLGSPRLPDEPGPAICAAANAYLGVPYLLGGTRFTHIDCSGLVARAYAEALAIVVPRNSNDQLAICGGEPIDRAVGDPGDLLFMRSRATGRTHVALATGRDSVIHASRSRNSVLEEPISEFEADAEWMRRVPWPAIVAWSVTQVGRDHVELPNRR